MIVWLDDQFANLCATIREMPDDPSLNEFRDSLIEGTDGAFVVFLDALEDGSQEDWSIAEQLMADRRTLMQTFRARFIQASGQKTGGNQEQAGIVEGTNSVEIIFFLLGQLTREYRREASPK